MRTRIQLLVFFPFFSICAVYLDPSSDGVSISSERSHLYTVNRKISSLWRSWKCLPDITALYACRKTILFAFLYRSPMARRGPVAFHPMSIGMIPGALYIGGHPVETLYERLLLAKDSSFFTFLLSFLSLTAGRDRKPIYPHQNVPYFYFYCS